jgi:hypothetical protein
VETTVNVVIRRRSLDRSLPIFQLDIFLENSSVTNLRTVVLVVQVTGD